MDLNNELDPGLDKKFKVFREGSSNEVVDLSAGREYFLLEARQTAELVTKRGKRRHTLWTNKIQTFIASRKEKNPMFNVLATLFLIATVVFGGGTATVAAAQSSQPNQMLYGVKLLSEDILQQMPADPQAVMELDLKLASRRAEEVRTMVESNSTLPDDILLRYRSQLEEAVRIAANLPADQSQQALEMVQTRLQTQLQTLQQVQPGNNPQAALTLESTRLMLQLHLDMVEQGKSNPAALRIETKNQIDMGVRQITGTPNAAASQSAVEEKAGSNPWVEGTPTPGSGYGPGSGDGTCDTCTPTGNGQGSNPWAVGTPTPGSGYGPGPGLELSQTCTPGAQVGQGTEGGQSGQPESSGSGAGAGSGDGSGNGNGGSGTGSGGKRGK